MFFKERGERRDQFAKDLAAELDIDVEEVKTALENIFKKHLDQAVEDGMLTQKQADRILACHNGDEEECRPPFLRGRRGDRGEFGLHFRGGPGARAPTRCRFPRPGCRREAARL